MGKQHAQQFPKSYDEAAEMIAATRLKFYKNLRSCRNTALYRVDNFGSLGTARYETVYQVKLYNTNIVTFLSDGGVILRDDGWKTVTTKARMWACGFSVGNGFDGMWTVGGEMYVNGIVLDRFGNPVGVQDWAASNGITPYPDAVRDRAKDFLERHPRKFSHLDERMQWKLLLLAMHEPLNQQQPARVA